MLLQSRNKLVQQHKFLAHLADVLRTAVNMSQNQGRSAMLEQLTVEVRLAHCTSNTSESLPALPGKTLPLSSTGKVAFAGNDWYGGAAYGRSINDAEPFVV